MNIMNMKKIEDLYSDYLEDHLDAAARRSFEARLEADPAARAEYALFAACRDLVRDAPPVRPATDLERQVLARLEAEASARPPASPQSLTALLGLAAGLAIAAVAGAMLLAGGNSVDPAELGASASRDGPGIEAAEGAAPGTLPDATVVPPSGRLQLTDADLNRRVNDIKLLIERMNQESDDYRRREEEFLVAVDAPRGQEIVFRPAELYRRSRQPAPETGARPASARRVAY